MKAAKGDDEKISMITDHINQLLTEVSCDISCLRCLYK